MVGLKLFAYRSWLEKFAQHPLATTHSCLAIPDTLHLSSCILPPRLNTVPDRQPRCSSIAFPAPAISLGPYRPHHDTPSQQLLDHLCQISVPLARLSACAPSKSPKRASRSCGLILVELSSLVKTGEYFHVSLLLGSIQFYDLQESWGAQIISIQDTRFLVPMFKFSRSIDTDRENQCKLSCNHFPFLKLYANAIS